MRKYHEGSKDYKPIATICLSNYGGLVVLEINYGIDDTMTTAFDYGEGLQGIKTTPIHTAIDGRFYIIRYQKA